MEKLEEDNSETMFFITKKQQKTILTISLDSLNVEDVNNGISKNIKFIK